MIKKCSCHPKYTCYINLSKQSMSSEEANESLDPQDFSEEDALMILEAFGARFGLMKYVLCAGVTKEGHACQQLPQSGKIFCVSHKDSSSRNPKPSFCLRPPMHVTQPSTQSEYQCQGFCDNGRRCHNRAHTATDDHEVHLCGSHAFTDNVVATPTKVDSCVAKTLAGRPCKNAKKHGDLCTVHAKKAQSESGSDSDPEQKVTQLPKTGERVTCTQLTKARVKCSLGANYITSAGHPCCKRHLDTDAPK